MLVVCVCGYHPLCVLCVCVCELRFGGGVGQPLGPAFNPVFPISLSAASSHCMD